MSKEIRNIVLLGHQGCGKTSTAEALLYISRNTTRFGHIVEGNTVSDYETEERNRQISVQTSLVPLLYKNYKINILDTPGYLEFEVSSSIDRKVEYEKYLTKNDFELEVPPKFVKVYLTDENDVLIESVKSSKIPTYFDLKVSDINPSGRVLYSGNLKNKGSKKFKLRMWVADTYELTVDARNFSVNLNVKEK